MALIDQVRGVLLAVMFVLAIVAGAVLSGLGGLVQWFGRALIDAAIECVEDLE